MPQGLTTNADFQIPTDSGLRTSPDILNGLTYQPIAPPGTYVGKAKLRQFYTVCIGCRCNTRMLDPKRGLYTRGCYTPGQNMFV